MNRNSEQQSAVQEALSASVQVLPLPPGLYLFSVKSVDPSTQPDDGSLRLPAMHVGLGPGVRAEQVEFVAGPSTNSGFETAWLSDDEACGTKGMAVPLIGFAVRLKPGAATANYDCEYSGYFKSGLLVGPLRIARRAGTSARAAAPARTARPARKAAHATARPAKPARAAKPARKAAPARKPKAKGSKSRAPAGRRPTAARRPSRRRP